MLSEISQTEKDRYYVITHVESRKRKSQKQRSDWWFPEVRRGGGGGEIDQKVQTFSYKIKALGM